jgi:hypothetical protein
VRRRGGDVDGTREGDRGACVLALAPRVLLHDNLRARVCGGHMSRRF